MTGILQNHKTYDKSKIQYEVQSQMDPGLMINQKISKLNSLMLHDFRNTIQTGLCNPVNTGISVSLLEKFSNLTDAQITLLANKFEISLYVLSSPHDKEPSVFWEDLVFLCEQENDAELEEMLGRLVNLKRV